MDFNRERSMKRQTLWLAAAAVFLLPTGACNSDKTTGTPALSARVEGNTGVLRDVITFFTRQFSASGDVAVMRPDGSDRRPLPGSAGGFEPAVAPDGRRLVFSRVSSPGVTDVVLMNVDGTGATPLVRGLVLNGEPAWSPDGCQIAFRSARDDGGGPTGRISIINVDGTGLRQLTPEPSPGDFAFDQGSSFSPDGSRLAFTRNLVLHVINVDGTGLTPLPNEDLAQSPSWSPDGQRIAYMSLDPAGDIHVRNADGSNLVRLTTTPEFESWPRWSPDDSRLVFSRVIGDQVTIFTINADGSGEARLTPADVDDFMPDWGRPPSAGCDPGVRVEVTPSAAGIAVGETRQFTATVRSTSGTVVDHAAVVWSSTDASVVTVTQSGLVTAVGSGTAQIQATFANVTGSAVVTVANPTVLRDAILYATDEYTPGVTKELAVVHPDGTGRRRLTTDAFGATSPDISPDGRRIVFPSRGSGEWAIYIMNADGTGRTLLVQRSTFDGTPAWSPDGSQIAFRSENETEFGPLGRIFVINVDGTGLRQVSPDTDPNLFFFFDGNPTWSPDGSRIAFIRNDLIYVINADGTGMTALPGNRAANPDWSPDGTRLVYSRANEDGSDANIYVINADGSNPVSLTATPEYDDHPRWSPDGRRIVFCRVINEDHFELFIVNEDGSGALRLTQSGASECPASWSPVP